jgi:AraC-like DNA-binding protein
MDAVFLVPDENLSAYVKSIMVLENELASTNSILPFFADGCPGIMFQMSDNGVYRDPQNKKLTDLFLYGQTIHPIRLAIEGRYRIIVFQLFPFAMLHLLSVNPKELNDDCFDLSLLPHLNSGDVIEQLKNQASSEDQVSVLASFLTHLIKQNKFKVDDRIKLAVDRIIHTKGKITIKSLREQLCVTERTFERQFTTQVGVTPKKFAKIIQFQYSFSQLINEEEIQTADIVYDNGFADQSHFIKSFKNFTGSTPAGFKKSNAS